MREAAIGIDLGTTNSVVAISSNGVPRVIAADGKHKINPSMVAFLNDGRILVGRRAKAVQQRLPERTIYNTKRLIGRFFGSEEVERVRTLVPFELMEGPRGDVHVAVGDRAFSATDISSILLNFLKKATERTLNEEIRKAVITVPAHFNDNQRHATQSAARMAGLEPIRILNEPTAAAIAYGLRKGMWKRVAVYDFGGGTFDISILDIAGDIFEVAATAGDTYLGGADIDRLIAQDFVDHVTKRYGVEVGAIPGFIHNLLPVAEQVKILLSENAEVVFNLEGIRIEGKTVDLQMELTQRRLAELSHELVQRSFLVCDDALRLAGLRADDIDEVVLTGGQTMMPVVQQAVAAYFRKAPRIGINPMEAVAIGAAVLAEQLTLPQRPAVQSFFGAGKGAGSTSGALGPAGDDDLELDVVEEISVLPVPRALLLDVTPMTLRLATTNGYTTAIVDRNTTIPLEKTKSFYTARENQSNVSIRIYQGESAKETDNQRLGSFSFSGLQPGDDGRGLVEVTFAVNADGILQISARDAVSGARRSARIDYTNRISEEEIQARLESPEDLDRIQF